MSKFCHTSRGCEWGCEWVTHRVVHRRPGMRRCEHWPWPTEHAHRCPCLRRLSLGLDSLSLSRSLPTSLDVCTSCCDESQHINDCVSVWSIITLTGNHCNLSFIHARVCDRCGSSLRSVVSRCLCAPRRSLCSPLSLIDSVRSCVSLPVCSLSLPLSFSFPRCGLLKPRPTQLLSVSPPPYAAPPVPLPSLV